MLKKIKQILYRSIETKEISYEKMQSILKEEPNCILLDVRSPQEFMEGHLEGAVNIPIYNLKEKCKDIIPNKGKVVLLYCSSGYRSRRGKEILENLGYTSVYNLKKGLDGI